MPMRVNLLPAKLGLVGSSSHLFIPPVRPRWKPPFGYAHSRSYRRHHRDGLGPPLEAPEETLRAAAPPAAVYPTMSGASGVSRRTRLAKRPATTDRSTSRV